LLEQLFSFLVLDVEDDGGSVYHWPVTAVVLP